MTALGENPDRPDLVETPRRWADWWREFLDYDAGRTDTAFASTYAVDAVVVSGIRVWSLCEHHLLPFWCDVAVAYMPRGEVLGLSKFARLAQREAHKLQVQERLVSGLADAVVEATGSRDVAVLAKGEHLCMTMRGAKSPALMTSLATRGRYKTNAEDRAEFLRLAGS